ncbi:TetR/AcrR family transcriptional regulator [Pseudomonas sp. T1.Ur]|uniref:TetR/AcrR family transcriptional regulator n=1 Tax=Pseudomonas sp. T1.Ur TaxID=2928704 RepID=UPI00201DEFE2|nr:TetR/AcrR family transcriptional regulator [Pseudomonas sp. T1.Ur]MCL6701889.1 TetR/AcrR family transcriptional regulator [Pseudomonas sp. T1.Ur]
MSSTEENSSSSAAPRRRLARADRQRQLLDVAWRLVREEGSEALTLARLAEQAGVTKPIVYDHFITRSGLLAALYQDFDARQTALMDAALEASEPILESRSQVIADAFVECVLLQGREIPGVSAALSSSPELELIKREYERIFLDKCRSVLEPFAGNGRLSQASLRAMLGAAEALSDAAANGDISADEAKQELFVTIVAMVERAAGNSSS